jgi:hypothetical protein
MSLTTFASLPTTAELQSYKIIAEVASNNPHWRKVGGNGTPETIVATILSVMLLARELGISPIQAVSGGINNIQGKFEISARLMNQLIRRHGHKVEVSLLNDEACKIWGQRKDTREEMEVTYHIEEARRSGLVKDGGAWKKTPQDMLFARAISRLARRLYPDCIGGCYVEGELQETIQGKVIGSVEMPRKDEIDIKTSDQPVQLSLPCDVSEEKVNLFLKEISEQTKNPINEIKKAAASRLEPFLEKFRQWESKKYAADIKEMVVA